MNTKLHQSKQTRDEGTLLFSSPCFALFVFPFRFSLRKRNNDRLSSVPWRMIETHSFFYQSSPVFSFSALRILKSSPGLEVNWVFD